MIVTTPSGCEVSATLMGKYRIHPHARMMVLLVAMEPGTQITDTENKAVFDWLLNDKQSGTALFDRDLKEKDQITGIDTEHWNDPQSGRPRITYRIAYAVTDKALDEWRKRHIPGENNK